MSLHRMFSEFHEWLIGLPPDFLFLMVLPMLVAMVGVAADKTAPPANRGRLPSKDTRSTKGVALAAS